MAYLTNASFREASLDPACAGLALTDDEAEAGRLTDAIATMSQRVDDICDDHFEQLTATAIEHDVTDNSPRLPLLKRCTSVTAVKIRNYDGTLGTAQTATVYRLHSSLESSGSVKVGDKDWLDLVPYAGGLAGTGVTNPYVWPCGPQSIQVTGNFGWTTTPGDIKRAVALLVWDLFKREGGDVRRASRWARGDLTVERAADSMTGMPEADEILKNYIRGEDDDFLVLIG